MQNHIKSASFYKNWRQNLIWPFINYVNLARGEGAYVNVDYEKAPQQNHGLIEYFFIENNTLSSLS